ncbi:MAG: putative Type IV pilus pilin [Parcubacteria bacterium C7867-008]|nr:MAG: putative Type IV pilus pilin [Parcubacteria bacterium C7867-008]
MKSRSISYGFTLIELLVVIAILGTLSSIVMSSLNTARDKARDAAMIQSARQIPAQAELFYVANGDNYNANPGGASGPRGLCDRRSDGSSTGGVKGVYPMLRAIAEEYDGGNATIGRSGVRGVEIECNDYRSGVPARIGWSIEIPLKAGGYYCMDYLGNTSTTTDPVLGSDDLNCKTGVVY